MRMNNNDVEFELDDYEEFSPLPSFDETVTAMATLLTAAQTESNHGTYDKRHKLVDKILDVMYEMLDSYDVDDDQ